MTANQKAYIAIGVVVAVSTAAALVYVTRQKQSCVRIVQSFDPSVPSADKTVIGRAVLEKTSDGVVAHCYPVIGHENDFIGPEEKRKQADEFAELPVEEQQARASFAELQAKFAAAAELAQETFEIGTVHDPLEEALEEDDWTEYTVIDENEAGTGIYSFDRLQYSYPLSRAALFNDVPMPESLFTLLVDMGINDGKHVFIREEQGVMDYEFYI